MHSYLAIITSAFLVTISFPVACYTENLLPHWVSAAAIWFAYVPIGLSLRNTSERDTFRNAYFFGFLSSFGVLFWVIIAMQKYGGLSLLLSGSILFALVFAHAFYPALTFWTMTRLKSVSPMWITGTLIFVLLQWTLVYLPFEGFPWATPAYALYGTKTLIQIADLGGTVGLNLLIVLFNFTTIEVIESLRSRRKIPFLPIALLAALLVSSFLYGVTRKKQIQHTGFGTVRAALLQGNIPQNLKMDPNARFEILKKYQSLSAEASASEPDLIVWPEAAVPMVLPSDTQAFPFINGVQKKADYILGAASWVEKDGKTQYFNSAFVVSPNGHVTSRYDKQHLVPFGEYVPLSDVLPTQKFVPSVAGNFKKGTKPVLPSIKGWPYGILICYEVLFPDLSIDYVKRGAQFLVNITNDAWFDQTSGPYQHLQFGAFRAIETRRSIVRAANTGFTTWFDPLGVMHNSTRLFEENALVVDVPLRTNLTFYVRHPFLLPHILIWILIAACFGLFRPKRDIHNEI